MKWIVLLVLAAGGVALLWWPSDRGQVVPMPDGIRVVHDVPYRDGPSEAWRLDLYLPADEHRRRGPRPCVVVVHGGFWITGTKTDHNMRRMASRLLARGHACASLDYRLADEAPLPACIEDVQCAVRWLRARAAEHGLDPRRIGGYGNSAGAHLVAMLGLVESRDPEDKGLPHGEHSSLLQAVCGSAIPVDLRTLPEEHPEVLARMCADVVDDPDALAARLRDCSPTLHVHAAAPPFLIFQGDRDKIVPAAHIDVFVAALRGAGARTVELVRMIDAGHNAYRERFDDCIVKTVAFFDRHLAAAAPR